MSYENPLENEDAAGRLGLVLMAVIVLMLVICACARADLTVSLGDFDQGIDNGTSDDVYVDHSYMASVVDVYTNRYTGPTDYENRIFGFDSWRADQVVLGTFVFEPMKIITDAWLTMVYSPIRGDSRTDILAIEGYGREYECGTNYRLRDLGWHGSRWEWSIGTMSLSPHIKELYDGKLNFALFDDTCLDYATLSIQGHNQTVPVPGALLLGMIGLGMAGIKLRRFV